MVDDQRIGDHGIDSTTGTRDLGLPHAVADDLATAELDLFAVDRPIIFDLDDCLTSAPMEQTSGIA
jgi:hypothetical protein